jgi:SAM-dependent methyltransferase
MDAPRQRGGTAIPLSSLESPSGARGCALPSFHEFHLATIDRLPLPDASVDCIISNCVINLAPDKPAVFREMFRVLKPRGRVAISDIALKRSLPKEVAGDVLAYVGCIAGAVLIDEYERDLRKAGFDAVQIVDTGRDLNAYAKVEDHSTCCTPASGGSRGQENGTLKDLLSRYNVNDYASSVQVYAVKGR